MNPQNQFGAFTRQETGIYMKERRHEKLLVMYDNSKWPVGKAKPHDWKAHDWNRLGFSQGYNRLWSATATRSAGCAHVSVSERSKWCKLIAITTRDMKESADNVQSAGYCRGSLCLDETANSSIGFFMTHIALGRCMQQRILALAKPWGQRRQPFKVPGSKPKFSPTKMKSIA